MFKKSFRLVVMHIYIILKSKKNKVYRNSINVSKMQKYITIQKLEKWWCIWERIIILQKHQIKLQIFEQTYILLYERIILINTVTIQTFTQKTRYWLYGQ